MPRGLTSRRLISSRANSTPSTVTIFSRYLTRNPRRREFDVLRWGWVTMRALEWQVG
jgi:hypothetical protein